MPPTHTPPLSYILHAWDMYLPKSLLTSHCATVGILQRAVDQALSLRATVITIRVVPRLPEPKPSAPQPPLSIPRDPWTEGWKL